MEKQEEDLMVINRPEPAMAVLAIGLIVTAGIDVFYLASQSVVIKVELVATLTAICIAGLWYAAYEYQSLARYKTHYRSLVTLLPALKIEATLGILRGEKGKIDAVDSEIRQSKLFSRNEKKLRKKRLVMRLDYINLCRIVTESGIEIPKELHISDDWQWERMMKVTLP